MNAPVNPEAPRPVFVDEVDGVVEFIDSEKDVSVAAAGAEARDGRPLLTDIVDGVVEFIDAAGEEAAGGADGPRPVFVDEVDGLVEFVDEAIETPSSPHTAKAQPTPESPSLTKG